MGIEADTHPHRILAVIGVSGSMSPPSGMRQRIPSGEGVDGPAPLLRFREFRAVASARAPAHGEEADGAADSQGLHVTGSDLVENPIEVVDDLGGSRRCCRRRGRGAA